MKNSLQTLIVLLISASLVHPQLVVSQTRFEALHQTVEFKFSTWNTEWLSCAINDPSDDNLQINNVVAVLKAMNSDIIALQEVGTSSTYATIDTLVRRLGAEWAGEIIPSSIGNCYQNQGVIYKKAKVKLVSASLLTDGGSSYDWSSGRFPVFYEVNLLVGGNVVPVSFINIHAKAMDDPTSYNRRKNASQGLKALLDGSMYNTKRVVLLGDFNDYLTGTQCSSCLPAESPYKNFMDDTQQYKCLTPSLYDPVYNSPLIDNIIISNELVADYIQNSTTREVLATLGVLNYAATTSDHTPISASFSITVGVPDCQNIAVSETFAQSLGNFTPYSVSGTQLWNWRPIYGACISGYATVNNPNEDWFLSPVFDLSGKSSATIAFNHALNYCSSEADRTTNHTLCVSTNYIDGAPESATWTALTIPNMPLGNNWTFVNSGNVVLPAQLMQKNVRFAFKYLSTVTVASSWEIKDLTFTGACSLINGLSESALPPQSVYVSDKQLLVRNEQATSVAVYDITGRILYSVYGVRNIEIPLRQAGVYFVRVGNNVHKVMVK